MIEFAVSMLNQLGLYALLALSLSIVFGVSRVVNLAVGDFATIGAFVMVATAGLPFSLGVLIALVIAVPLLFVIERGLLSRLTSNPLASLLVTWGVGMAIRQVCEIVWGSTARSVPLPLGGSLSILGFSYPTYRVVVALIALLAVAIALAFAYRTRAGLRLRAVADNASMAALMGTGPARTRSIAFIVAGLLAVFAGALYSPLLGVNPSMGFTVLMPPFVALLLARPGSFRGAIVAACLTVALQVALRRLFTDTAADALFYLVVLIAVAIRSTPIARRFLTWFVHHIPTRSAA